MQMIEKNDIEKAEELFDKSLLNGEKSKSADIDRLYYNKGNFHMLKGDFESAKSHFRKAFEGHNLTDREKSLAYYNYANSALSEGKVKDAIESYIESIKKDNDNIMAKHNLAYALKMLEQQENEQQKQQNQNNENSEKNDNEDDKNQQNNEQNENNQEEQQQEEQQQEQNEQKNDNDNKKNNENEDENENENNQLNNEQDENNQQEEMGIDRIMNFIEEKEKETFRDFIKKQMESDKNYDNEFDY